MAEQGMSMVKACDAVGLNRTQMLRLIAENKEICDSYTKAREAMADKIFDDILVIADTLPPIDQNGKTDNGAVNHQRLRVDARKWVLSRLLPKKYGDKMELSGDQDNPIAITKIERVIIKK